MPTKTPAATPPGELPPPLGRMAALDGIRGVAIAMVLCVHFAHSPGLPHNAALDSIYVQGNFGVQVFFVLSGFLITHLLLREERQQGSFSLAGFYARRAVRILPPAYLYLAVLAVLTLFGVAAVTPGDLLSGALFFRNMAGNALAGDSLLTHHFWSLAIEEHFYLLSPLLLALLPSRHVRLWGTVLLLAVAPCWRQVIAWLVGGAEHVNWHRTDLQYDALLTGCLFAIFADRAGSLPLLSSRRICNLGTVLLAVAAIIATRLPIASQMRYLPAGYVTVNNLGVGWVIYVAAQRASPALALLLEAPPLVWLGRVSYSVYLWQQLYQAGSDLRCPWILAWPLNLAAALATGVAGYYLVEKPLMAWRKHLQTGGQPPLRVVPTGAPAVPAISVGAEAYRAAA